MKNNIKLLSILITIVICIQFASKNVLSEPFVVLEYRNNNSKSFELSNFIWSIFKINLWIDTKLFDKLFLTVSDLVLPDLTGLST